MSPTTALLEQSFLDLIAAIERASELSGERRRHWVCSLQQIANWLDRPAAVIPARWNAVQIEVGQLHHARLGVTSKTLANHRSNVRAALRWFGQEQGVPQRGARLSARWARFCDRIDARMRGRLYSLIRYCSARGIDPAAVDDRILDEYWRYRTETTARASNNTARRFMVRAWNNCAPAIARWPLRRLTEPPIKVAQPAWSDFPERLRSSHNRLVGGSSPPGPTTQSHSNGDFPAFGEDRRIDVLARGRWVSASGDIHACTTVRPDSRARRGRADIAPIADHGVIERHLSIA